jgi:hypothetical protein
MALAWRIWRVAALASNGSLWREMAAAKYGVAEMAALM